MVRGKTWSMNPRGTMNQVVRIAYRDLRQQNSVDHAGVPLVELPKRDAVALARRSHPGRVLRNFQRGRLPHRPGSQACREQVTSVAGPGHARKIPTT